MTELGSLHACSFICILFQILSPIETLFFISHLSCHSDQNAAFISRYVLKLHGEFSHSSEEWRIRTDHLAWFLKCREHLYCTGTLWTIVMQLFTFHALFIFIFKVKANGDLRTDQTFHWQQYIHKITVFQPCRRRNSAFQHPVIVPVYLSFVFYVISAPSILGQ